MDLDFKKASFKAPQIASFDHRKRDGILEWPRSCFDGGNGFLFFQSASVLFQIVIRFSSHQ